MKLPIVVALVIQVSSVPGLIASKLLYPGLHIIDSIGFPGPACWPWNE